MDINVEVGSKNRLMRLMNNIQRQDQVAFEEFYHLTKRKIFATVLMIVPNGASAEDVVQEVYARIWNKALSYDPTKSSPITWAAIIARNLSIDRIRFSRTNGEGRESQVKLDRRASTDELENVVCPRTDVLSGLVAKQEAEAILEALVSLNERDRQLIEAAYFRGESREKLSVRFKAPVNTIKTWLRRAVLDLQARFSDRDTAKYQIDPLISPRT
jgi:RNA polymerase sigma-70 factor (ECF subfamily)